MGLFAAVAENQLDNLDLNKDGIKDKIQAAELAKDFETASHDLAAAVDFEKFNAGLKELEAGGTAAAVLVGADLYDAKTKSFNLPLLLKHAEDPKLQAALGLVVSGALSMKDSVDGPKASVAIADLKKVKSDVETYFHPPKKK